MCALENIVTSEEKLPCEPSPRKFLKMSKDNPEVYGCMCRKKCDYMGAYVELEEHVKMLLWLEPENVTKLPMCTKYSKKSNGNGGGK